MRGKEREREIATNNKYNLNQYTPFSEVKRANLDKDYYTPRVYDKKTLILR